MAKLDYSKYVDRLTSFNDRGWPAEIPIFIKALVEAGFSYSGESDKVFCYQCGIVIGVGSWKEDVDPVKEHEQVNKDCLFLQRRLLILNNGTDNGQIPPTNDEDTFDWVNGEGVLQRKYIQENNTNICETSSALADQNVQLGNDFMKVEVNRFQSFATCPIMKEWPSVEILSKNGFYWKDEEKMMSCFCCGCEVDSWETPDQDVAQRHKSLSPQCNFVNNLPSGNVEMIDNLDVDFNSNVLYNNFPNSSNNETSTIDQQTTINTSNTVPPVLRRLSPYTTPSDLNTSDLSEGLERLNLSTVDRSSNSIPSNFVTSSQSSIISSQSSVINSPIIYIPLNENNSPSRQHSIISSTPTSPYEPIPISRHSRNDLSPSPYTPMRTNSERPGSPPELPIYSPQINRSSSYPPNQDPPMFTGTIQSPVHVPIDLSSRSVRLKTFLTYPKESPVQPVELAEAGFYYVSREDCTRCYKCNILLGNWSPGDRAWDEHRKFSPNCVLVQERFGNLNSPQHQFQSPQFPPQYREPYAPNHINRQMGISSIEANPSPRFNHVANQRINSYEPYREQNFHSSEETGEDRLNRSWPSNMFHSEIQQQQNQQQRYYEGHRYQMQSSTQQHVNQSPSHSIGGMQTNFIQNRPNFPENEPHFDSRRNIDFHRNNYRYPGNFRETAMNRSLPDDNLNVSDYLKMSEQLIHNDDIDNRYGTNNTDQHLQRINMEEQLKYQQRFSSDRYGNKTFLNGKIMLNDDDSTCKICMDAAVEVTFVPCGHLVVCQSCSQGLKMCPICRKDVDESVRTYFYGN